MIEHQAFLKLGPACRAFKGPKADGQLAKDMLCSHPRNRLSSHPFGQVATLVISNILGDGGGLMWPSGCSATLCEGRATGRSPYNGWLSFAPSREPQRTRTLTHSHSALAENDSLVSSQKGEPRVLLGDDARAQAGARAT